MKISPNSRLVYSTDSGRVCPGCGQAAAQCKCTANKRLQVPSNAAGGVLRVQRETKGRGGKSVTVVHGLALDAAAFAALAKQLKTACGSGGTAKDGVIEVQGDHVVAVMAALVKLGYVVKRSGG
jgi:translation initiation factor 1